MAVAISVPNSSVTASAVAVGEVAPLEHKSCNNPMIGCTVIGAITNEFLKILNVSWRIVTIQFNGDFTGFKRAVSVGPRHLKDDILPVCLRRTQRTDDHKHDQEPGENGDNACQGRGAVSSHWREHSFTDSCVLHLIEKAVVLSACSLVLRIGLN